jgi:hypothetical protein
MLPLRAPAFALLLLLPALPAHAEPGGLRFGMDPGSIAPLDALGAKPDLAVVWAGSWDERSGWHGVQDAVRGVADQGVEPVVQWWYWGDDISPDCVEHGCWDRYQGVWKDQAGWLADSLALADAVHAALQGRPGLVVLETEFNKNGIEAWEPFDALLAQEAFVFRALAPEAQLVLGFGDWDAADWPRFDEAARSVDFLGFQALRGSTRDSAADYASMPARVLATARTLQADFGKPVLLDDLALATYGADRDWGVEQARALDALFAARTALQAAGLTGIVYRALQDDSAADPANYYGPAEATWGLRGEQGAKPGLAAWVHGVQVARN